VPALADLSVQEAETAHEISKAENLLSMSEAQLTDYLRSINRIGQPKDRQPSTLEVYTWFVAKEKAIYTALNMLRSRDPRDTTYTGFIWAPLEMEQPIKEALQHFPTVDFNNWRANTEQEIELRPPTYFKNSDPMWVMQNITNTYGIPSYQEANPAVFAVVTFPFLFGIMFGDYGHGSLILVFGLFLVFANERLAEIPGMKAVLQLRYMVMMMGFFSCYNGLLYNEWFAIPYDWFGTCYDTTKAYSKDRIAGTYDFPLGPDGYDCVYPFGLDPTWFLDDAAILLV